MSKKNFTKDSSPKDFRTREKYFANELENPDNYCFIRDQTLPSGVLDISSCQYDAPIYLSFPHFYLADPYYLKIVHGLQPNSLLHKSYIDVELITGVSVGLAMRVQVNVHLEQNSHFVDFENVISGIYPVFWIELSAEIDDNLSKTLKEKMDNQEDWLFGSWSTFRSVSSPVVMGFYKIQKQGQNMERKATSVRSD
ncbi:platelet glycoprotein 4 [Caerostris extrusa]|uniref:Platelet glycoprotein 4 n=1 Tax=Caerostris extrusa TaxID=172846 RepID=A0AAV4UKH9_CAEEX|nr:platelet glycoprotein 4 [Caerostris extrusa]